MKNISKLVTLSFALALAAVPAIHAQAGDTPPPHEGGPGGPGGPGGKGGRGGPNIEQIAEQLGLTADQKAKLGPVLKEQAKKMQELRKDESLSQEQRREKGRALREEGQKEINAILTPEQAKKFAEMRERGPRGGGDRPGKGKGEKGDKPKDN